MPKSFVIGNWKLNPTKAEAVALLAALESGARERQDAGVTVGIAPPFVYLGEFQNRLAASPMLLGAQDVSEFECGAFTGEVSAGMLVEHGCDFVIVGHSERRQLFAESDATVARKVAAAQSAGLMPVLCVGETLAEREQGVTLDVVSRQVGVVLDALDETPGGRLIVAYEPIWAIGTERTATPEMAEAVHAEIRGLLASRGVSVDAVPILYGGSVNAGNAAALFAMPSIDGGLVGGASLKAEEFLAIVDAAHAANAGSQAA